MKATYGPYGVVRRTQCISNLKSIVQASLLYAEANNDRLMPSLYWTDSLSSHTKNMESMFQCPCAPLEHNSFGYAYNSRLSGARVSDFELPEHTVVAYESSVWRKNTADPLTSFSGPYSPKREGSQRANVAYLGGFVERMVEGEN